MILLAQNNLMAGLVSYWGLGSVAEALNRNTLTAVNAPTFAATGGKPGGKVTLASASSQYLTRTNANCNALGFGSKSFSLSLWANPTAVGVALARVIGKGGLTAGAAGFYVGYATNGRMQFQASDGTTLYTTSGAGTTAAGGSWTHFVCVCNRVSDTITIYKNGVSGSSASCSGMGSVTNSSDLYFSGTPTEYNGALSGVGIWNRPLAAWEASQLYRGGNGLAHPFNF